LRFIAFNATDTSSCCPLLQCEASNIDLPRHGSRDEGDAVFLQFSDGRLDLFDEALDLGGFAVFGPAMANLAANSLPP